MSAETAANTLLKYRDSLVRWGEESEIGIGRAVKRANKLFEQNHEYFKALRESPEGRKGITALTDDENPYVRATAAGHSLLWAPEIAIRVLEEMEGDERTPWRMQISAEYTLKEWRSGDLSFDW